MNAADWIIAVLLTLLLAEGFALVAFPDDFRRLVAELDPRVVQAFGVFEAALGAAALAAMWFGS